MARAELYDKQSVIDYYNDSGLCMYRVYSGYAPMKMNCRYEYLGNDTPTGESQLSLALDNIARDKRNTNVYCLQLIKEIEIKPGKKGDIVKEIPAICICFQINDPNNMQGVQRDVVSGTPLTIYNPGDNTKGNDYGAQLLQMLQQQNASMIAQMSELQNAIISLKEKEYNENDDDDDDLEEITLPLNTKDKILSAVGSFLERPQVQDAIMMGLMGLASKLMPQDKKE
jgi:hypothetical protein